MQCAIEETVSHTINYNDIKWRVPPEDVKTVNATTFVKVRNDSRAVAAMISKGHRDEEEIQDHGRVNLTRFEGYHQLMTWRNKAQAEELVPQPVESTLFGEQAQRKPIKVVRLSRSERSVAKNTYSPIEVDIKVDSAVMTVQMLRPMHPCDALWVQLDTATVSAVMKVINQSHLLPETARVSDEIPGDVKGIHKRKQGRYVVKTGNRTSKLCKTLSDAIETRREIEAGGGEEVAGDGEDAWEEDAVPLGETAETPNAPGLGSDASPDLVAASAAGMLGPGAYVFDAEQ